MAFRCAFLQGHAALERSKMKEKNWEFSKKGKT